MADENLTPVDDDFAYKLQDMLAPSLREGKKRARKANQNLVAEKIIGIESALVALEKALVSDEATAEASAAKSTPKVNGNARGTTKDTFPT